MGSEAENIVQDEEVIVEDEATTLEDEVVVEDSESDAGETVEDEGDGELEIVREGTQPQFNQQQVNDIVNKRVKRLNSKLTEKDDATSQSNAALDLATERNKILELALEQAKQTKAATVKIPDPSDFNDGVHDPEYIKQQAAYNQVIIAKQVAEQVAAATQNVTATQKQDKHSEALLSNQVKHYERANEMGIKNYGEIEDKAISILGNETVIQIIDNFDDAHVILAYLGTERNSSEAKHIANLIKTKPIRGVAEVGRLSVSLKLKPKNKTVADPDEEIQGDGNTQDGHLERKLAKLREEASKTGNMKPLMDFKKKNKL